MRATRMRVCAINSCCNLKDKLMTNFLGAMSFVAAFGEGLQRDRFRELYELNIAMTLVYSNKLLSFSTLPDLTFISTISKPQKQVNNRYVAVQFSSLIYQNYINTEAFPVIYLVNNTDSYIHSTAEV